MATLVVEAVSHLMTDNHTDGTIVKGIISSRIKERGLKDSCREADLVGGRVIVSIHGLRSHIPLIIVHRLTSLLLNLLGSPETVALHHVLKVSLLRIDIQSAHILPLVRIADLHIERTQLVKSSTFGLSAHPSLCLDALAKGNLQVLHQLLHALLGGSGEVTLTVDLTEGLTHLTFHLLGGTFPERIVLLTSTQCLSEEIEVCCCNLLREIAGSTQDYSPLHIGTVFTSRHALHQLLSTG